MKRVAVMFAVGTFALLLGCSSDGIEFNGQADVQQFPVRTTPIQHYQLPSEIIDQVSNDASLDASFYTAIDDTTFNELGVGYDLWGMVMTSYQCADNPTCRTLGEVPDWQYMFNGGYAAAGLSGNIVWPPGGAWPHPLIQVGGTSDHMIAGWIMSVMNQWYLRGVDGTDLPQGPQGQAPVQIESLEFSSMKISIHEVAAGASGFSPLLNNVPPAGAQQETGDPGTGANGKPRVQPPINNVISWTYGGDTLAPVGLLGMGWHEEWAVNRHIETNVSAIGNTVVIMNGVPVPDYFGGGSVPSTTSGGGGVFTKRYIDAWWQTTDGNPVVPIDNGLVFSYYAAVIGCHVSGYGIGLVDSAFASPGVLNDQEDIMVQSAVLDMTAFIAAEKEFQFVTEDLQRMQDVVNGDWSAPGPLSTLPGTHRK
jgi:hypothetical protein